MSEADLPWNRFPTFGADAPPASPQAPAPKVIVAIPPGPPAAIDWDDLVDGVWPTIRDQVVDYARASAKQVLAGKTVDLTHPDITATDMTGRELIVADAKSRSWRTLVQGLIFDVFAAVIAAVAVLSGADPFARETWIVFGVLLLKSVVSAVISYFMRLKVTPTIRTEGEKYAIAPVPRPMPDKQKGPP
jgi:hypothetical protein